MIPKDKLNGYLIEGYSVGIPKSEKTKIESKKRYSEGSYIHKEDKVKFVNNSLLENYFADGWELGKKSKDQYKSIHHKYF